uniref:Uncharacterized protein n=1 Tax=Romanomermis culicivorax TaxID=13658 RepID=A0A915J8Q8_ROMCU
MQPPGLWCDAHKSRTHHTEDCVCLKGQNAQQLSRQEPNRLNYAAHSRQADLRTNSNDIRSQRDWRPPCGGPPQRGISYARGMRNHFYEKLQLALPALPPPNAASTPALEKRANNQSTSMAN